MINILKGRTGPTIDNWLADRPQLDMTHRDRAGCFGEIISRISPNNIQIADVFHILDNIMLRLKNQFFKGLPSELFLDEQGHLLPKQELIVTEKSCPEYIRTRIEDSGYRDYISSNTEIANCEKVVSRQRRFANPRDYAEKMLELQAKWNTWDKSEGVEKAMETFTSEYCIRNTQILTMTEEELIQLVKCQQKPRKSVTSAWHGIIIEVLKDNKPVEEVFYYCKIKADYTGDAEKLWNKICEIKHNYIDSSYKSETCTVISKSYRANVHRITRQQLWYSLLTMNPETEKTARYQLFDKASDTIYSVYPECLKAHTIMDEFYDALCRNPKIEKLDAFLKEFEESDYKELKSFCAGIRMDYKAVCNAILYPHSTSGYVEGGNRKFKLIQNIVFGHWGDVTCKMRAMLGSRFHKPDFHIEDYIDWHRTGKNVKAFVERIGQCKADWD